MNICSKEELAELYKPEHFDEKLKNVTLHEVSEKTNIITNVDQLVEKLHSYRELGISRIVLHNVSRHQELFIEDFSRYANDFI